MPSIQRTKKKDGSESFRVQVSINGLRDSASFNTKAEAKQWGLQREAQLRVGIISTPETSIPVSAHKTKSTSKPKSDTPSRTLKDVLERYRGEVTPSKLSRRWEEIKLLKIARYAIAAMPLDEIGPEHLAEWRDSRLKEVSSSSVRRELSMISCALELARKEWRWIESNPCRDIRKPPENKHRIQRMNESDVEKLLHALGYVRGTVPNNKQQEVAVALLLALETACRGGELLALTREHIHLDKCFIHLPTSKNGHSRDVPLSPAAAQLLQLMLRKPPKSHGKIFSVNAAIKDALFRRAKNKVGLRHINFHDSRREATSRLAEIFEPLELARITGHRDLKMLLVYYQKSASDLAQKFN